ncbi:protein ATP6V1FNB-like [Physella acuta]|uniref:protein ATP6V1FNB-like n=1 Tax=Physella acuta TaxID=109671 RepID=UPI0027DC28CB|nr:protein ATP6V1FNB-like [Physella acuta]
MARNPYANTQMQNFWKETVEKEASARLQSFAKMRCQERSKPRQLEVFRKRIEDNKPSDTVFEKLPPIQTEANFSRKKADLNAPLGLDAVTTAVLEAPEMRAPSPMVLKSLYDGFTKEEKGRYIYLKQRHQTIPEVKFAFPTLSSWEYGWRLGDVIKKEDIKKPKFGRTKIVEDTFYTRNGLMSEYNRVH